MMDQKLHGNGRMRKCLFVTATLVAINALSAQAAMSGQLTKIPALTMNDQKEFWRVFMHEFYGPYDVERKCWVSRKGSEDFCMRPNTFDLVTSAGQPTVYATASGNLTTYNNPSCQNCSGNMGFYILRPDGDFFSLLAESDRFLEEGTNGEAPNKDNLKVVQVTQNGAYAWVAKISSFNRGTFYENAVIYAAAGKHIASIGIVPLYYNDHESSCFDLEKNTDISCSDFRTEMSFDLAKDGRFAPIALQVTGTIKGQTFNKSLEAKFDDQKSIYVLPEGFPEN
jgi:hypothetical protein